MKNSLIRFYAGVYEGNNMIPVIKEKIKEVSIPKGFVSRYLDSGSLYREIISYAEKRGYWFIECTVENVPKGIMSSFVFHQFEKPAQ